MPIVDRKARDIVAAEVRRFLNGETTAFAFDDAIDEVESDDPTVRATLFTAFGITTTTARITPSRSPSQNGTTFNGCS